MKAFRRLTPLILVVFVLTITSTAFLCGKERWKVKTCKDAHAKFLFKNAKTTGTVKTPKRTTIATLDAIENPFDGHLPPDNNRVTGTETTIWEIEGTLFQYKKEGDEDYHLALRNGSNEIVAEIPSPDCLIGTPTKLKKLILKARSDFDAQFTATGSPKDANIKVRITGPAMFDKKHPLDPIGDSPNHLEIHPILTIKFTP